MPDTIESFLDIQKDGKSLFLSANGFRNYFHESHQLMRRGVSPPSEIRIPREPEFQTTLSDPVLAAIPNVRFDFADSTYAGGCLRGCLTDGFEQLRRKASMS